MPPFGDAGDSVGIKSAFIDDLHYAARAEWNPSNFVDNIHLGWWVAGDLASANDLDTLAALNATARYNGHVIGDVASNFNNEVIEELR